MSIYFFGSSSMMDTKRIGELYQPKSRMMVGADVLANTSSAMLDEGKRNVVIGAGDDVKFGSMKLFDQAKNAAQKGGVVINFRSIESGIANKNEKHAGNLQETEKYVVAMSSDNYLSVFEKDEKGNVDYTKPPVLSEKVTGDARLTWDENNEPILLQGADALTGGTLKALGDKEVLIRNSGVNVEGGDATTVYNLSETAGSFSGGNGVTYLGSYAAGSTFSNSNGATYAGYFDSVEITATGGSVFRGVFERAKINADDSGHSFSGYFGKSATGIEARTKQDEESEEDAELKYVSVINGGNGKNVFSGMFADRSRVNGGDGDDKFNGRFMDSKVNGGAGDDSFGSYIDLNSMRKITDAVTYDVYQGLESDFINTDVDAGEGDDSFNGVAYGGTINMGDGDDTVKGVFTNAAVLGGMGNDDISAMYSSLSRFDTGEGDDKVSLATATGSNVTAGEGKNEITLGRKLEQDPNALYNDGAMGVARAGTTWQSKSEYFNKARANDHGELNGNRVNAETGDNRVRINSGEASHTVMTGDRPLDPDADEETQEVAGQANVDQEAANGVDAFNASAVTAGAQVADKLNLLNTAGAVGDTGDETGETAGQAQKRKRVERYAMQSGDPALQSGALAATVSTGAGDDLVFRGMGRQIGRTDQEDERREFTLGDEVGMYRATRRGNSFGAYDILKFNR